LYSYIIERKNLGRGAIDQWVEVERNVSETAHRLTGYDPQADCLYRVRAANEFGISETTMPASYYGKPSTSAGWLAGGPVSISIRCKMSLS